MSLMMRHGCDCVIGYLWFVFAKVRCRERSFELACIGEGGRVEWLSELVSRRDPVVFVELQEGGLCCCAGLSS
jgi:hypothetical protein